MRLPRFQEKNVSVEIRDYKPGDVVPHTGIYTTQHSAHLLMHEATLEKGMRFPRCKRCDGDVRFSLRRRVENANVAPLFETEFLIVEPGDLDSEAPASAPFSWRPGMPDRRKNGQRRN